MQTRLEVSGSEKERAWVCMCVCEKDREREKERKRGTERERDPSQYRNARWTLKCPLARKPTLLLSLPLPHTHCLLPLSLSCLFLKSSSSFLSCPISLSFLLRVNHIFLIFSQLISVSLLLLHLVSRLSSFLYVSCFLSLLSLSSLSLHASVCKCVRVHSPTRTLAPKVLNFFSTVSVVLQMSGQQPEPFRSRE